MVAETRHRLRFALEPESARLVEPGELDARDRDLAVEPAIVAEIDALHRAFAEQPAEGVATVGDAGGRRGGERRDRRRRLGSAGAPDPAASRRAPQPPQKAASCGFSRWHDGQRTGSGL